ncbi:NADP-dependent oxidoreductase [Solimonas fluminis]|uniref:NADP-dependent oxidoreductase n=1 Tax=Solimonas fluminis TaxID=2086571 RepID=A0A2S5TLK5_9GAMM|nr:NADP-dependent oxidoreductase [Solimonas fluminis]PPE75859.1 NADP-dependent oxidoreductase [Solimonas fluminis]
MSATMRAMAIGRFGGPEELQPATLPRPEPGSGELLVRVAYAGVNPADWKTREGWLAAFFDYRFPFVPGFDLAGTVVEVGEGADASLLGRRVVAYSRQGRGEWGSYAEYAQVWAAAAVPLPDSVELAAAAALPTAGITAWEGVFEVGRLRAGQKLLVHGGAGGVGRYAIQLARHAGAEVAATCSAAKRDDVLALGAVRAFDYRDPRWPAALRDWAPEGVDLLLDAVGQGSLPDAVALVRRGGVLAPVATLVAGEPQPDARFAAERGVRVVPAMSDFARSGAQLRELVALSAAGLLQAPPLAVLPLAQAGEAQRRVQAGEVRGKLLLQVEGALP